MRSMKRNKKGSMVILVAFTLIGLVVSLGIGYYLGAASIGSRNSTHDEIAQNTHVINIPYEVQASVKFVGGSSAVPLSVFGEGAPEAFSYNTPYDYSEYVYKVQGDTNAYMKIYGAANDGKTYYGCIVSCSMHQLQVTLPTGEEVILTGLAPRYDFTLSVS